MSLTRSRICGIADEGATTFERQLGLHESLGLSTIELRTLNHLGLDEIPLARHERNASRLAASGIAVPVLDSPIGGWSSNIGRPLADDLQQLSVWLRIAECYGCKHLRIMSYPNDGRPAAAWRDAVIDRLGALAEPAADAGCCLLLENCDGWAGASAAKMRELLRAVGSDVLAVVFDTGNGVAYGYRSLDFLQDIRSSVKHVHLKDGRFLNGKPQFVRFGAGESQVRECLQLLETTGYTGLYSVEPHIANQPHLGIRDSEESLARSYIQYVEDVAGVLAEVAKGPAAVQHAD